MKTGVYMITIGARFYIGSTSKGFNIRRDAHLTALRKKKHANRFMQAAFNKYGEDNFCFTILLHCKPEECVSEEQNVLDDNFDNPLCMNLSPTAGSTFGVRYSDEVRSKLSAQRTGKKLSQATRQKHRERMLNYRHSEESKRKIAESNRRRRLSDETKKKISEKNRGKTHSAASRELMSKARRGVPKSPETRARMAIANRARAARERREKSKRIGQCFFSFED
jgi:group I intron endonuclease